MAASCCCRSQGTSMWMAGAIDSGSPICRTRNWAVVDASGGDGRGEIRIGEDPAELQCPGAQSALVGDRVPGGGLHERFQRHALLPGGFPESLEFGVVEI